MLKLLTAHILKIAEQEAINKMDLQALAVAFAPSVMGTGADGERLEQFHCQCTVLETIFGAYEDIFEVEEEEA